jgi:hypothetical protein
MVWEQTVGGAAVSVEDRAAFQLAATHATHSAAAAVELAYTAGEGSANYRRSPLQRQLPGFCAMKGAIHWGSKCAKVHSCKEYISA